MSSSYTNPILPGFNPDPSIIRSGNFYYLITSSFEYFPGIPLYRSTDLISWTLISHVLTRPSQLNIKTVEPGGGIWAPTLREHKGEFYVTAACFERYRPQLDERVWPRGFYVKTNDIEGEWGEPVWFDQVGFDQDLFWDNDDTVYLSTTYRKHIRTEVTPPIKDFAIHITTVDLATGRSTSLPKCIRASTSGVAEGSHILKRNGYYYLFTAEGGTESGHCEWVARSKESPFGPWEVGPSNPLWRNGIGDEVQNTGHADFVEDAEGNWWAVCLGVRPLKSGEEWRNSVFGRETFLTPMTWSNDDWPVINSSSPITLQSSGPGKYQLEHSPKFRDDFTTPNLKLGWYRKNTPLKPDILTTNSTLTLLGSAYTVSSPSTPTLILRKQSSRVQLFSTLLRSYVPNSERTEAGVVIYWNHFSYASLGVRLSPAGKRMLRLTHEQPAGKEVKDVELRGMGGDITFFIKSTEEDYVFGYMESLGSSGDEQGVQWLEPIPNTTLTIDPPIGMAFTGMMMGLYAFGEMEGCLVPAEFGWVEVS
ncbi:Arabinanase/levansucrase/invertase [Glarea lozoyensis ATCC 20868]|uniref:Arabinanase/levansucrase/invertase n=1 Tax=Glarea lozoyensis (strain ATCC 20868 / MF5171) TaxID=1116229 RepID=S3DD15_GLAL2|nr:Arabinanase/levansucrase/invertase [Glarea lozoyensis ATCC 20868]EPE34989.1 Arabinanase/levansucrase/invertase [Glarea lozoyensis ATCC 20868]